jgi:protein SCO1/2
MQIKHFEGFGGRGRSLISASEMANQLYLWWVAAILVMAVFTGCERSANPPIPTDARSYEVRGMVRGIAPDRSSMDVEHEDIPGFMPSMTMPFLVHDAKEIAEVRIGDAVSFRMIVTDKDLAVTDVRKIDAAHLRLPARSPSTTSASPSAARLHEGDNLPAFVFSDQDGRRITNDTFRGRSLILTFIFTRCAVPNFCQRMSNNFSELQKRIQDERITNARLLSISLDPAFDTPAILKEYGEHLAAAPDIWTFATGDVDKIVEGFSVYRKTEGGTLSHGLATALVNGDGKILKIWRGNEWKPEEVITALRGVSKAAATH